MEQVMPSSPLENSVVVRMILSHFSAEELLELSTVNKFWNSEARSLLRDFRKCEAFIQGRMPCVRARLLDDHISHMKVVPFNALSVEIRPHECPWGRTEEVTVEAYANLINKLQLKQLTLSWYSHENQETQDHIYCILCQLLLLFLSGSSKLERLEIKLMPLSLLSVLSDQATSRQVGFPKLKSLKLPPASLQDFLSSELIQEVITTRAPNLQILENKIRFDQLPYGSWSNKTLPILPSKCGIIKALGFETDFQVDEEMLNDMQRFSEQNVRLLGLRIRAPAGFANDALRKRYRNLLCHLLKSSCDTLEQVEMDAYSVTLFASKGTPVLWKPLRFPNVTQVVFHVLKGHGDDTGIAGALFRLPMQSIFPSAREVIFAPGVDARRFILPLRADQAEIPWPAVTKITILQVTGCGSLLQSSAPVFPSVHTMRILEMHDEIDGNKPKFQLLWNWPGLKHIELQSHNLWHARGFSKVNYDAEFCGIYPEEVEDLQWRFEHHLKAVHIVPPFPAINHLRGLRKIKVELSSTNARNCVAEIPEDFFLSNLTLLAAISRMYDLEEFQLIVPSMFKPYVAHLEPWVEVELRE